MYRKTYASINSKNLINNVKEIKTKYPEYEYYIGVVKNDAYHHGLESIKYLIEGGINYLAVSSIEEALSIRNTNIKLPILCLEPIHKEDIGVCIDNDITITVESLDMVNFLENINGIIKIHIKLDTGMNRLGIKTKDEFNQVYNNLKKNKYVLIEGIYSHFATSGVLDKHWDNQLDKFLRITEDINFKDVPIIHFGRSLTLVNHKKIPFCNGIRLGIIMFGHSQSYKEDTSFKGKIKKIRDNIIINRYKISGSTKQNDLKLKTAFSLYSEVISIREVNNNEFVGYNAKYIPKGKEHIATIPVGYADGVTKEFKNVYIRGKKYNIVSDSCDMIMVVVDSNINVGDLVEIFGKNITVEDACKNTGLSAYYLYNKIQNRVPKIIDKDVEGWNTK